MRRVVGALVCIGILIASVVAGVTVLAAIPEPVKIDTGSISGASSVKGDVRFFKGIPYAAPPIGPLRWKPPQPAAHWDGVRKAEEFGARCMQGGGGGGARGGAGRGAPAPAAAAPAAPAPQAQPATSEDCLFINVWTAAASASERRPVILFVYGGGFTGGAGSEARYDGEAIARKGVVFVTFNYRLGVFGLLAHPELTKESGHNASGNYAVMDTIAALRWIQKNIRSFGGDPGRVTLMGESAGAILISNLGASPEAKGLFHRVIAESGAWMGTGINKMTTLAQAEEVGARVLKTMNAASIAELRAKPADELQRSSGFNGSLIVDGWMIPEDSSKTYAAGKQNEFDILAGSNKDEATFFGGRGGGGGAPGGGSAAQTFITQSRGRFEELTDSFLKLYPAGSDAEATASGTARTNDEFHWHMLTWAKLQSKRGKSRSYLFFFTRVPPGNGARGATHTAELPYAFNNLIGNTAWTDQDRQLSDTMSSYWANFAANGDPNGKALLAWPPYKEKTSEKTMVLGDKVELGAGITPEKAAFFDAVWTKLGVK